MNRLKIFAWLAIAFALQGCASYKPVPEGYKGPVATVTDSGLMETSTKAQIFAMMEVDGNAIDNSFAATARRSRGQGFQLMMDYVSRQVPATPMKVKLKASHTTGAPIHAIFSQVGGAFYSVEGVVDFAPVAGRTYLVQGALSKEGSAVWIEDLATRNAVTEKITGK